MKPDDYDAQDHDESNPLLDEMRHASTELGGPGRRPDPSMGVGRLSQIRRSRGV
jgi:hypothetical protein